MSSKKVLKTCPEGHKFYKSSDCPTCPVCEEAQKPETEFLSLFAAPARRALENAGIMNAKILSQYSEKEILNLHGIGRASLPILRKTLEESNLSFKEI